MSSGVPPAFGRHITARLLSDSLDPMDTECWRFSWGEVDYYLLGAPRPVLPSIEYVRIDEMIVKIWRTGVPDGYANLGGSWALLIHNRADQSVYLICDRLGTIPIYYSINDNDVLLSTKIGRFASASASGLACRSALLQYIVLRHSSGAQEVFRHVQRPLPGSAVSIRASEGRFEVGQSTYFKFSRSTSTEPETDTVHAARLLTDLEGEIRAGFLTHDQFAPKAPLGVLFSSGLDSSLLVKLLGQNQYSSVECVTFGFEGGADADLIAARESFGDICPPNARWSESILLLSEVPAAFDAVIKTTGKPIDHPNFLSRYRAYEHLSSRDVRFVMTGEGADTLFGGAWYQTFLKLLNAQKIAAQLRRLRQPVLRLLSRLWPKRKQQFALLGFDNPRTLCLLAKTYLPVNWLSNALGRAVIEDLDNFPEHSNIINSYGNDRLLDAAYEQGLTINMTHELIGEQAMALSHELLQWHPYADGRVAETANTIPTSRLTRPGGTKRHLSMIGSRLLPPSILNRRKFGAPAPIRQWFAEGGPLSPIVDRLLDPSSFVNRIFDGNSVAAQTVKSFRQCPTDPEAECLWVLVNLQRWSELCLIDICDCNRIGRCD